MKFHYSKENLKPRQAKLQRFLEILPGACSWSVLLGLIFLSIFFPFMRGCPYCGFLSVMDHEDFIFHYFSDTFLPAAEHRKEYRLDAPHPGH